MKTPYLLFCLALAVPLSGQQFPDCNKMLRDGDACMARKDPPLEEALRCYLNALNCNSQLAGEITPKLQRVFDAIKHQKESEIAERKRAENALEASRKGQISKLMADAVVFRKDRRFDDALRACAEAAMLAKSDAEKKDIELQRAETQRNKDLFDFERNRNIALALKAANDCRAALPYFTKALAAHPDDETLKTAQAGCHR